MALSHVTHNIEPVFDSRSRILVLGTMPSPRSRETGFFYGHPQNRFWKALSAIAEEPEPESTAAKRDFLLRHHIALWDVVASCDIDGASDASITNVRANDLSRILDHAPIEAVFTTGKRAGELYHALCEPITSMPATVLPSPSSANARMGFEGLTAAYRTALAPYIDIPSTTALQNAFPQTEAPASESPQDSISKTEPLRAGSPVLDVADVVALEQRIAAAGTSLYELMHRAGRFLGYEAQRIMEQRYAILGDRSIAILCGKGNNGGDGWVAADHLRKAGYHIDLISPCAAHDLNTEPARTSACELEKSFSLDPSISLLVDPSQQEVDASLQRADLVIDALLGTGFSGNTVHEPFASWIQRAQQRKQHGTLVVAADVPSGFNAQTGEAARPCMKANLTVTMICLKTGLCAPGAHEHCGTIKVAPLAYLEPLLN